MLHPGELSLTRGSTQVSTILGSCVAFTMRHPESQLAAICHCLLATVPLGRPLPTDANRFSYLDIAFEEMLSFFRRSGISPGQLQIKLFGGSDVLQILCGRKSVGRDNIDVAKQLIAHHGLSLAACDVGGKAGRRILFNTDSGQVFVRRLKSSVEQHQALAVQAC